jgi:hypothetical protein
MIRRSEGSSIDLKSLFDQERQIAAVPQSVRFRMLSRAQAALRAGENEVAQPPTPKSPGRIPWAVAAGLVCLASAAGGAAAYEIVARTHRPAATDALSARGASLRDEEIAAMAQALDPPPEEAARSEMSARPRADLRREELRVLEPARVAVARGEFAKAMRPIAEHARRFKEGRLAEEREALRVKALTGLGRTEEARRAAASFASRFPRSPLLPAISQISSGPGADDP